MRSFPGSVNDCHMSGSHWHLISLELQRCKHVGHVTGFSVIITIMIIFWSLNITLLHQLSMRACIYLKIIYSFILFFFLLLLYKMFYSGHRVMLKSVPACIGQKTGENRGQSLGTILKYGMRCFLIFLYAIQLSC